MLADEVAGEFFRRRLLIVADERPEIRHHHFRLVRLGLVGNLQFRHGGFGVPLQQRNLAGDPMGVEGIGIFFEQLLDQRVGFFQKLRSFLLALGRGDQV